MVPDTDGIQIPGQDMLRETGLLLVKIYRDKVKPDRGMLLHVAQNIQHDEGILASGQADHHQVPVTNHIEIGNSTPGLPAQILLQAIQGKGKFA
jgi:hypothetical protein